MIRRFVNVVAESRKNGMYSLHRLGVAKHLFYPSTAEAKAVVASGDAPPMIERLHQLPEKIMSFRPNPSGLFGLEFFGLVSPRKSEDRIICIDSRGHALLFDADERACQTMPSLRDRKGLWPISFSIGLPGGVEEDLYIMCSSPVEELEDTDTDSRCFEVLKFRAYGDSDVTDKNRRHSGSWNWVSLPPPPFVYADEDNDLMPGYVSAHTVIGRNICISSSAWGVGTYCFDTVQCKWHQAGDWVLPFEGRVEYIPEHNICLGFSQDSNNLCATSDLTAILSGVGEPPKLLSEWPDHLVLPEEWCCEGPPHLINLGSGRFCVAKIFKVLHRAPRKNNAGEIYSELFSGYEWKHEVSHNLALLTGLELDTTSGGEDGHSMLRIVPHKSISYIFDDDVIQWVL